MTANIDRAVLPAPFSADEFMLLRSGVYDDATVDVYINLQRDFAFLSPQPATDYAQYRPRAQRLSLEAYRARNEVIERRYAKIVRCFPRDVTNVLEIGASDGAFLARLRQDRPDVAIACVEPDLRTGEARSELEGLRQYGDLSEAVDSETSFDRVCLFHVLEHVLDPAPFLAACRAALREGGRIIIEVPSLDDPLLSLYQSRAYEAFYFQLQHPYVYSATSLDRLLAAHGFSTELVIPHQRYGLENHLTWLATGVPGGDEDLRTLFSKTDVDYRQELEGGGLTDAVIIAAA